MTPTQTLAAACATAIGCVDYTFHLMRDETEVAYGAEAMAATFLAQGLLTEGEAREFITIYSAAYLGIALTMERLESGEQIKIPVSRRRFIGEQ